MRNIRWRWPVAALGVILLVFGLACLNYTKPSTLEHHREWAARSGAPAPGDGLLAAGVLAVSSGACLVGGAAFRGRFAAGTAAGDFR